MTRTGAHSAPRRGELRPASLVVEAAGVAVEAAVVQLLLLVMHAQRLLAWREVLEAPRAHELLRSQLLLLLLRGQLPLELSSSCDAQRRQALCIPAARPSRVRKVVSLTLMTWLESLCTWRSDASSAMFMTHCGQAALSHNLMSALHFGSCFPCKQGKAGPSRPSQQTLTAKALTLGGTQLAAWPAVAAG